MYLSSSGPMEIRSEYGVPSRIKRRKAQMIRGKWSLFGSRGREVYDGHNRTTGDTPWSVGGKTTEKGMYRGLDKPESGEYGPPEEWNSPETETRSRGSN